MKTLILLLSLISLQALATEHGNALYEAPSDDEPQYYTNAYGQRIELYRAPLGTTAIQPDEAGLIHERETERLLRQRQTQRPSELEQNRECNSADCAPGNVRPNAPPANEDNEYRQEAG